MIARLLLALLALTGTAHAGAGGTFAPGSTTSIVVGVIAIAVIVLVIMRARRK
jgi:hypothetical protein